MDGRGLEVIFLKQKLPILCIFCDLFECITPHHHGPGERLVEAVVHTVDKVREVVNKVSGGQKI